MDSMVVCIVCYTDHLGIKALMVAL